MMRWNALPAPGIWAPPPKLQRLLDELRELRSETEYVFVMPTELSFGLQPCDLVVRHVHVGLEGARTGRYTSGMRLRFPTTVFGRRFETAEEYLQAEIDRLLGVKSAERPIDPNAS